MTRSRLQTAGPFQQLRTGDREVQASTPPGFSCEDAICRGNWWKRSLAGAAWERVGEVAALGWSVAARAWRRAMGFRITAAGGQMAYCSYVFLLTATGVHQLPHEAYVALGRGEAVCPQFAGMSMRLADWHVRLEQGRPVDVVQEWYGWVWFDSAGCFHPAGTRAMFSDAGAGGGVPAIDTSALPGPAEVAAMCAAVFGIPR